MNYLMSTQSLKDTFNSLSTEVLINNVPQQAVITMAHLGMQSKRHLHSLEPFNQGDYVVFNEETYLVVEDVINPRGVKYKATIEYCNYKAQTPDFVERVLVGVDPDTKKPIYEEITTPGIYFMSIIKQDNISIVNGAFRLNTSQFTMTAPNNAELDKNLKLNNEIVVYDRKFKIVNINKLRTGLLEVTLEKTS